MNYTFCISRTDSIGDVVLTLPLAGYLKKVYPNSKVIFLAKKYTSSIIALSDSVDEIIIYDEFASATLNEQASKLASYNITHFIHVFPNKTIAKAVKRAKIPHRIGTSHRFFHLLTCNERVDFTRRNSELHEAQLNFRLLDSIIEKKYVPTFEEIHTYLNITNKQKDNFNFQDFGISDQRKKLILHPKSQGSAVEWGVENFCKLTYLFEQKNIDVIVTGTEKESVYFREQLPKQENVYDLSGKLTLEQLITLIEKSDFLVAASTGPLHIAAILNKYALGLYSPRKPIHPGRWKPIGKNSDYLVFDEKCSQCMKGTNCNCISNIGANQVYEKLEQMAGITF